MKKLLTLTLAAILTLSLAACGAVEEPQDTTVALATTATTTAPVTSADETTTTQPWDGVLRTEQLKAFYERHKDTMLELADILLALDMLPINEDTNVRMMVDFGIYGGDGGFSGPYYTDKAGNQVPFGKEIEGKLIAYHTTALKETGYYPFISARMLDDNKRLVTFAFDAMDAEGLIVYMPDGYAFEEHPAGPEYTEWRLRREVKLAENWYSYGA